MDKTIQSHSDAYRPFSNRVDPSEQLDLIDCKLSLLEKKISAFSCLNAQQTSRISSLKRRPVAIGDILKMPREQLKPPETPPSILPTAKSLGRAFAPNDPTASHFEEILKEMDGQLCEAEEMAEALRKQIEPFISNGNSPGSTTESVKVFTENWNGNFWCSSTSLRPNSRWNRINAPWLSNLSRPSIVVDSRDPFAPKVVETEEKEREREQEREEEGFLRFESN